MVRKSALLFCLILAGLSVFQLLLIFGAPLGHYAWGGQNEILPTAFRIGSAVSLCIYAVFALFMLQKAKIIQVFKNQRLASIGVWVIFGYSCIGILANAASRSTAERNVMTPLIIIMTVLSFIVARSKT